MPSESPSPTEATPMETGHDEWTPEQLAAFQAWSAGYGEQDENGIDLSLIRSNLNLTPWQRACRGDDARRNALALLEYGRRHREQAAARPIR